MHVLVVNMKLFKFGKNKSDKLSAADYLKQQCSNNSTWEKNDDALEILVNLINVIRPANPHEVATLDLSDLIEFLKSNTLCADKLSHYISEILDKKIFNKFLSDAAILQDSNFISEVRNRLHAKFLPNQPKKDRLEFVLNQVFYRENDHDWVNKIPFPQLVELFTILRFNSIYDSVAKYSPLSEVLLSMQLITMRIGGRAMETEVIKMVPEFDDFESPFNAFEAELIQIQDRIFANDIHYVSNDDISFRQLNILHKQCEDFVEKAFANSSKYGISMRVNQSLLKIRQQLARLKVLMPLLVVTNESDKIKNSIDLGRQLIKYNCYKNNIRKFISESTQLISYEITQHTARTGEAYITDGRTEYFKMLRSALGGGLIVGILVLIKLFLSRIDTSYFGHALLYSLNYAIGFIVIYLLGFTLATKQPAMTASALVKALEDGAKTQGKNPNKYHKFAVLFARVFRSQFIAFIGNVLMAFPIALLGAVAIEYFLGTNIAVNSSYKLLNDLSPIHSMALLHAGIAGIYLFLSGIISGSIANRDKHNQVYYRIQEHPLLKRSLGKVKTAQIASLYEKKWAGIVSNFWFGVFLGSTSSIGLFIGLNLDIRHITFASGNLALGLFGNDFKLPLIVLVWSTIGVILIGLVNFLVSFGLSLGLAFRSRNIPLSEIRFVAASIWRHFKYRPVSFFFPTKKRDEPLPLPKPVK